VLGLPAGQAFSLQIGNFGGTTTAPVQLDAGGNTASGTVTIGSCIFRFDRSTFPAGRGPQANAQFTIDTCEVDRDNRTLRLATPGGESTVSSTANLLPTTNVAFVLTTDFSSGSYAVVDLASRNVFRDIRRGGVDSDATPARRVCRAGTARPTPAGS